MANTKIVEKFCKKCNKVVKAKGIQVNHILHLCLTALTCGLWFIVYGFILLGSAKGFDLVCTECGEEIVKV